MKLNNLDRLHQAKDLVKGLRDTMFYIETAEIAQMIQNQEALNKIFEIAKETEITGGLKEKL